MIKLTRLNGKSFVLNCEVITQIESTPDTVITLNSGEKLMVEEKVDDVIKKTIEFKKKWFYLQDKD